MRLVLDEIFASPEIDSLVRTLDRVRKPG